MATTHLHRIRAPMKKLFLIAVFATSFILSGSAFAQIDDKSDPQTLIKTVTQQVLDEVRQQSIDPNDIPRIMDIVNRDILPYIDFRYTTQLAIGRYWRTATPEQQQKL